MDKLDSDKLDKKILLIFVGFIAIVLIVKFFTGCTNTQSTPTATTTLSPAEQVAILNTQVTDLQSGITALQNEIDALESPTSLNGRVSDIEDDVGSLTSTVTNLQSSINSSSNNVNAVQTELSSARDSISTLVNALDTIEVDTTANSEMIANLQLSLTQLQAEVDALQVQVDTLPTETGGNYDVQINALNSNISSLQNSVGSLTNQINTLQSTSQNLTSRLNAVEADIDNIGNALTLFDIKSTNWDNVYNEWNSEYRVSFNRFLAGSSYCEFITETAGNYVVVITLYGTDLDLITMYVPPSQNVTLIADNVYGSSNTMRVLILQPEAVGSPPVSPNWVANKIVEIDFTGSGFSVNYATITTGAR